MLNILSFQNMHIKFALCPSYPFSMSIKQKTTNTGKDMVKEQPLFTACRRAKYEDTMAISVEVLQKKLK